MYSSPRNVSLEQTIKYVDLYLPKLAFFHLHAIVNEKHDEPFICSKRERKQLMPVLLIITLIFVIGILPIINLILLMLYLTV